MSNRVKCSKICLGCGNKFDIKKGDRDYCSFPCKENPVKKIVGNCERCGSEFRVKKSAKFCSSYCRISNRYNTTVPAISTCMECGVEKQKADMILKLKICHMCFSKVNPKWVKRKKEEIPYFIEIERFLKKIHAQKYRVRYIDMMMIVHWYAEVDYFSTRESVDEMFISIQQWYKDKKREIFR